MVNKKNIVVIGSGFAGLTACDFFNKTRNDFSNNFKFIFIDRKNTFDFLPLAPDILAGWLSAKSACINLKNFFESRNFDFINNSVEEIIPEKNIIKLKNQEIIYDYLLICCGADVNFFGKTGLEKNCFKLNSINDALEIKNEIVKRSKTEKCVNIVVVGGGYTGIEAAMNSHYLMKFYHRKCRILIAEKQDTILPGLPQWIKNIAFNELSRNGIEIYINESVKSYDKHMVVFESGKKIDEAVCIWSAGVHAPEFLQKVDIDKIKGRIKVNESLNLPYKKYRNIFFAGDCCAFVDKTKGIPLRMAVIFSIGQAKIASQNILNSIKNRKLLFYNPVDVGYLIPLTYGKAPGLILGQRVNSRIGFFMHYLLSIYRSKTSNKIGIVNDLISNRFLKSKGKE